MEESKILISHKDGTPIIFYKSTIVPRIGEAVHFPHLGGFRVIDVYYQITDDYPDKWLNRMLFAVVIIDRDNPIKEKTHV